MYLAKKKYEISRKNKRNQGIYLIENRYMCVISEMCKWVLIFNINTSQSLTLRQYNMTNKSQTS